MHYICVYICNVIENNQRKHVCKESIIVNCFATVTFNSNVCSDFLSFACYRFILIYAEGKSACALLFQINELADKYQGTGRKCTDVGDYNRLMR